MQTNFSLIETNVFVVVKHKKSGNIIIILQTVSMSYSSYEFEMKCIIIYLSSLM